MKLFLEIVSRGLFGDRTTQGPASRGLLYYLDLARGVTGRQRFWVYPVAAYTYNAAELVTANVYTRTDVAAAVQVSVELEEA